VKAGVIKLNSIAVKNPVTLTPYRTFREVWQPESKFVFRLRGGDEKNSPQCALFEAAGEAWRIDCIKNIKSYLLGMISDIPIIA
jgi:hypothetical protein